MNLRTTVQEFHSNEGIGLVGALIVLAMLAVLALVAATIATTERRTSFNEFVHVSSFMSADSGGEAAIGWLRNYPGAPPLPNYPSYRVTGQNMTNIQATQRFSYDMSYVRTLPHPGSDGFFDYWYSVQAAGESGIHGNSNVRLVVKKQAQKQGY